MIQNKKLITNNQKSKHISKSKEELSLLTYQNLKTHSYIKQFLKRKNFLLYNYKFYINETTVNIFINYVNSTQSKLDNFNLTKKNLYANQLLESFNEFYGRKRDIFINFQCLNTNSSTCFGENSSSQMWEKQIILLKRYSKEKYFKESINFLILVANYKEPTQLFADFIAKHISTIKKQRRFFSFLRKLCTVIITTHLFDTKGIKITIKGRLNGAPRAKTREIKSGSISTQFFKPNVSFSKSTSFSKKGTFGVKVWIC